MGFFGNLRVLFFLVIAVILPNHVIAASGITYQGRILKPNGEPMNGSNVQFRIQIRTPGSQNCLMFEETKALDMRLSKGLFSLTLNDGTGARTDTSGFGLDRIFANSGKFDFDPAKCSLDDEYTPSPGDGRKLVVEFKDETMSSWEPMPATSINYVPFAFESKQIQGFSPQSLVRVQEADGTMGNIAPLSNANYLDLLNLIGGTSPNYVRASNGAGARVPVVTGNPLSAVAGSVWFDSVSGKLKFHDGSSPVDVGGGAGGGVTEVTAGSGLVTSPGAGITATGSIAIAVGGVVTNMLADGSVTTIKIGDSQVTDLKLAANSVIEAKIANGAVTSAKILDGTIAGSDLAPDITISTTGSVTASGFTTTGNVTVGGDVVVTGGVSATTVTSGTNITRQIQLFDPDTSSVNKITFTADAALNADYTLKWPLNAGSANQVLSTDGFGNLSWVNASSGADNLGNHTATQNIQLGNHWLSGDGGNEGLRVDANGNVGIGTTTPTEKLQVSGSSQFADADAKASYYVKNHFGSSNPEFLFSSSALATNYPEMRFQNFRNGFGGHPVFVMQNGAGSEAVPASLNPNATVAEMKFISKVASGAYGWGGHPTSAVISMIQANVGTAADTGALNFWVSDGSDNLRRRMSLNEKGFLGLGLDTVGVSAQLHLTQGTSSPAWGAYGIAIRQSASTFTDTSSSGTVADNTVNSIGSSRLAANAATTYTNAASLSVAPPRAGANATITNSTALSILSENLSGATNGYGLKVAAPTGATNNYAATFMDGNVGIGTTSPTAKLEVAQTIDSAGTGFKISNTAGNRSGFLWVDTAQNFHVESASAGSGVLVLNSGGGNVGVGTTTPRATLDVAGAIRVGDSTTCGAPTAGSIRYNGGNLQFCNGTSWSTLGSGSGSGDFLANGTVPMTGNIRLNGHWLSGDGGGEGLAVNNDGDTFVSNTLYFLPTQVGFKGGGNVVDTVLSFGADSDGDGNFDPFILFKDTGAVSIGREDVHFSEKLVVGGGAIVADPQGTMVNSGGEIRLMELAAAGGNYVGFRAPDGLIGDFVWQLPSSLGTTGQVLTTSSPGVLSWTTPSGGGGSPAGTTGQVQFNNGGAFGASTGLIWNDTTKHLGINGAPTTPLDVVIPSGGFEAARFKGSNWGDSIVRIEAGDVGGRPTLTFEVPETYGYQLFVSNFDGTFFLNPGTNFNTPSLDSMRFTPDGNMGLGVAPVNRLDVKGAMAVGTYAGTSTNGHGLTVSGSTSIGANSASPYKLNVNSGTDTRSVLIESAPVGTGDSQGNSVVLSNGHGAGNWKNQISFNAAGAGKYSIGNDYGGLGEQNFFIQDHVNNNVAVFINEFGDVGLGRTNPLARLHVEGDAIVSSSLVIGNDGDARKIGFGDWNEYIAGDSGGKYLRFGTNNQERVRIIANGNVGIGIAAPTEKLDVNGNVRATAFISTSDARLKEDIARVPGLQAVLMLKGVRWAWKDSHKPDMGVLAQDVEAVFPEAVVTDPVTGYKAVKYQALFAPLIESTKELYALNKTSEREIASLKSENSKLKDEVESLKARLDRIEKMLVKGK